MYFLSVHRPHAKLGKDEEEQKLNEWRIREKVEKIDIFKKCVIMRKADEEEIRMYEEKEENYKSLKKRLRNREHGGNKR